VIRCCICSEWGATWVAVDMKDLIFEYDCDDDGV